MRNLVVLNRSSEKQVIIGSILRHSGEINHAGTGELADESIKKPSKMSIFAKSNNVSWSVKKCVNGVSTFGIVLDDMFHVLI